MITLPLPASSPTLDDPLLGPAPLRLGTTTGLYIHVPFCAHICPYCDFNTYAGQDRLIPRYVDALDLEIKARAADLSERRIETISFGGGTPSLLPAASIERLLRSCRSNLTVSDGAEVSLEANPNGLTEQYLAALRRAGVDRLSIGAQTFNRRGLRTLGRLHEAGDVLEAVQAARAAGFDNVSIDLIFGWPGQTLEAWRHDLETILGAGPRRAADHLSLYSLIVEPGTPMADAVARGILHVADDDLGADLYELAMELLGGAGFVHYEVANWARDASLQSRHNRIYWLNGEYAGFGAGAHGHLDGKRTMNHLLPAAYCAAIEAGATAVSNTETITPAMAMGETMMLGLRLLREGVSPVAFEQRHGIAPDRLYRPVIERLTAAEMLAGDRDAIRLTRAGLMLANDVCAEFLLDGSDG